MHGHFYRFAFVFVIDMYNGFFHMFLFPSYLPALPKSNKAGPKVSHSIPLTIPKPQYLWINHCVGLWFELKVITVCHLRGEFTHSYFLQLDNEVWNEFHWPQPCNHNNSSHIWPAHWPSPFCVQISNGQLTECLQSRATYYLHLHCAVKSVGRKTVWQQHYRRRWC